MRILWVKVGGLWPCNTGGRLRTFNMLKQLTQRHRVTLLVSNEEQPEHQRMLERELPDCEEIVTVSHRIEKWRSRKFAATLAKSWLSPLPVDILRCCAPALRAEAGRRLVAGKADLCVADFLVAMLNVPPSQRVPLLMFEHNVEHMIWKRLASVETRPWRRAALAAEWHKLRRYEAAMCRRASLTVTVSPQDAAELSLLAPEAQIHPVPTGVDTEYFAPSNEEERPGEMVYVGSMDWQPNVDAVRYFMAEVLPRLRQRAPEAHLTVVGRNPDKSLIRDAKREGVSLTGTVSDVRPFLRRAAVCVVPLRVGGGTRLKIFEALSMGKAVVATPVGAEGLPLVTNRHYVRADSAESFAEAVSTLLHDSSYRKTLGENGRALVERNYSWRHVAAQFEGLCSQALNSREIPAARPRVA